MKNSTNSPLPRTIAWNESKRDRPLLPLLLAHQRRGWRKGERLPVEAYLAQQPGLRDDTETVLDLIYGEILLREKAGELPRLDDYLRRFPELSSQLRMMFDLETALSAEPTAKVDDAPTLVADRPLPPDPASRLEIPGFELLGELGRGGMGVVYKARQEQLNRIVALKMILAGEHAPPEAAIRFLGEAEAVARLHHPNIVQVHAFGDHGGHPYFAMEYVDGGSLIDCLDGDPWPHREAARLIQTLARAIHVVHLLGIVHRDLKPANVLMTDDGTPKIADFGLAKWLDVESGLTRTENVLGSPNYMAPEQTGGSTAAIGPTADVYSLGAILYELLTGRPPFRAPSIFETLELVRSADPIAPTKLQPDMPRDLETICLKCLQKDPDRRYPSADVLAEDLRRFAASEPIVARPVGRIERLWLWSRREPALAALAVVLIAGLLGVATQWRRAESHLDEALRLRAQAEENALLQATANRELRLANDRERKAHIRARGRFDVAMGALAGFEAITQDPALLREPHLGDLRATLLRTALEFYRKLQESLEGDASPGARAELSAAYGRIADLSWELGRYDEALETHRRALALLEELSAASPDDLEIRAALSRSHSRIGFTLRTIGRWAEGLTSYHRARKIQQKLVRNAPTDPRFRETLSWTLSNIGLVHLELGRPADAVPLHRRAIAIHEALVAQDPGHPSYRSDLAFARRYLGQAFAAAGDSARARRLLARAEQSLAGLVEAGSRPPEDHWRLARCRDEIGLLLVRTGQPAEAALPLSRATEAHEALARDNPSHYGGDLARNLIYVASQQAATGRPEEALAKIRRAEDLLRQCPLVLHAMLYDLACAYSLWGAAEVDSSRPVERDARAERAMTALRRAVAAGYRDLGRLRRDPLLDSLRHRPDFSVLLMDAAFPSNPFQK